MSLFFRLLFNWLASAWRAPLSPADTLNIRRRVGVFDLDLNLHMNHARYLRVVEQTVLDGMQRSGFLGTMVHLKAVPMIGGALMSYRREMRLWESYTVRLNHLGADARWHVFRIVFLNRQDQVVAWGLVKGAAIRWRRDSGVGSRVLGSDTLWAAHAARCPGLPALPALPPAASAWLALERDAQPDLGVATLASLSPTHGEPIGGTDG